ncbi:MAG: hypothetical protein JXR46_07070 [Calditrichaceae bacterium]|nr:hypothetical protein [Calditrichaceae bacterium]MBN2708791.1 hypothetical protein [Calditrichaceae bacterium]RQV97679.1 MAG: hypothetical protein EH224_01280 [Calditrichota bacterium]
MTLSYKEIGPSGTVQIHQVTTKKDLKHFINLPYQLRKNDPYWIPPLKAEQKKIFDIRRNSLFKHIKHQFFMLKNNGQFTGRIAAYINPEVNQYLNEKLGFIGYYECIDDENSANLLLKTAEKWLSEQGVEKIRGQWNFESQDIGLVIEGYQVPPVILSSQNPPFYNDHFQQFGFGKIKELFVYGCDVASGYTFPYRFINYTDLIARRYKITIRSINMDKLAEETRLIVRLTNEALADNWGFYPVHESEADEIARDLKQIINPDIVLFAEADGQPIGYLLALPDINSILQNLNGRLFPVGIFKLISGIKKINRFRVWSLAILKPYQQKGVSALLFRKLNETLGHKMPYVEANWVLEDNASMNNAMKHLKFVLIKKYRIYEKRLK